MLGSFVVHTPGLAKGCTMTSPAGRIMLMLALRRWGVCAPGVFCSLRSWLPCQSDTQTESSNTARLNGWPGRNERIWYNIDWIAKCYGKGKSKARARTGMEGKEVQGKENYSKSEFLSTGTLNNKALGWNVLEYAFKVKPIPTPQGHLIYPLFVFAAKTNSYCFSYQYKDEIIKR